jgi:predicted DCC family thiol-disulfide oxidoreductase YuxK
MTSFARADGEPRAIILFDGVCNFCSGSVNWIIRRDRLSYFRFAALQSDVGAELQRWYGLDPDALDTMIVIEGGRVYRKSTAALRIMRRLSRPWPVLLVLVVIPQPLRDLVYDWFARRRYRWFGERDECMVPTPQQRERFLSKPSKTTKAQRHG